MKFVKKQIMSNGATVIRDRVGSVVWSGGSAKAYYPFGEERTSTPNNALKFGSYFRDAGTGLDYANQRYFSYTLSRFMSADPYQASASASGPSSWNRTSYAESDPVNYSDPTGLAITSPYDGYCPAEFHDCWDDEDDQEPLPPLPVPQNPSDPVTCGVLLLARGTPINNQTFGTTFGPPTNTLGAYQVTTGERAFGYYFAVQLVAAVVGVPNDQSTITQSWTGPGAVLYQKSPTTGNLIATTMVAINMPDDAPFASNVNRNAPGLITFLDSPGTGKYGFPLVAGNFTYTFNTAFTAPSGSGCSINWSLTFYFSSGGFSITSRIN